MPSTAPEPELTVEAHAARRYDENRTDHDGTATLTLTDRAALAAVLWRTPYVPAVAGLRPGTSGGYTYRLDGEEIATVEQLTAALGRLVDTIKARALEHAATAERLRRLEDERRVVRAYFGVEVAR